MKVLGASNRLTIGATVAFGFAQIWAAYHLSARLQPHGLAGEGGRWLLIGAVLLMVVGEVMTALAGVRER